jgi:chaperone modulatory protein CbpM
MATMITEIEILTKVHGVTRSQLRLWVSESWVRPARSGSELVFNDADIARVRLLATLCCDFEVGDEAVPIILSLIDQVHDMQAQMRVIAHAIDAQPDDIRVKILKRARSDQDT